MEPREYVVKLLKNHTRMVREITSLRFELKNFVKVGDDEIIEEMALSHPMGDGIRSGRVSDKTTDVALRYREVADRMNEEAYKAVVYRLNALETAIERMDFYLSQMEQMQVEVLRGYYFEGQRGSDEYGKFILSEYQGRRERTDSFPCDFKRSCRGRRAVYAV